MPHKVAGMDVHKKVLMVVVATVSDTIILDTAGDEEWARKISYECRRFGSGAAERGHVASWLKERGVEELVMESTAQYWKPVWLDLEPHIKTLHLAQAHSNRAPKGRKSDFGDAKRLTRRLLAGELLLSFVPEAEQRAWRTMTRGKHQLVRDRVRLQNQLEALLEEMRIKLSSVVSDLLGVSGRRILQAMADGETDPVKLAELGDDRLKCGREELADALRGHVEPMHLEILALYLERLKLLDKQIGKLEEMAAKAMKKHESAIIRLSQVPGFGVISSQQTVAEVGADAKAFPSAGEFASWVGVCPGKWETGEKNSSSRSPKGNVFLRQILTQAAQAAIKKKGCFFQRLFRRMLPKIGYNGALWTVAHRLCRLVWIILHRGESYIEKGGETTPQAKKRRAQKLSQALRKLGYNVVLTATAPEAAARS
jgi:transposase